MLVVLPALFAATTFAQPTAPAVPSVLDSSLTLFKTLQGGSYRLCVESRPLYGSNGGPCAEFHHDTTEVVFTRNDSLKQFNIIVSNGTRTFIYVNDTLYQIFWNAWFQREYVKATDSYHLDIYPIIARSIYQLLFTQDRGILYVLQRGNGASISVRDTMLFSERLTCVDILNRQPGGSATEIHLLCYIDSNRLLKAYDQYVSMYGDQTWERVRLLRWSFSDSNYDGVLAQTIERTRERIARESLQERWLPDSFEQTTEKYKVGERIPMCDGVAQDGLTVSLQHKLGKLNIIDFSYASCGPCLQLMPTLDSIAKEYSSAGLKVIGLDPMDPLSIIGKMKQNLHLDYEFLSVPRSVAEQFGIQGYPTLLFVDRNGQLLESHVGYRRTDPETLRDLIGQFLKKL